MNSIEMILDELRFISTHPKQRLEQYLAAGKKVVGCLPYYCPEELVAAAGMVPFGLWGAEIQVSEAKRYFPPFICSLLQTTLELGLKGEFDRLTAVMIPLLCDSLKGMEANWRYGVKNVPVITVAQAQNRKMQAGLTFTISQYRKIKKQLEELSGVPITDQAIAEAVKSYNEQRRVMRKFLAAAGKHPELISFSDHNTVVKSSYFMDAKAHTVKVRELAELLEQAAESSWQGPKVVVSGITADYRGLIKIFDDCKLAVVDDQLTQGSLRFRLDLPLTADPLVGLTEQIGKIEGCPVFFDPGKQRGHMLIHLVKQSDAQGVIFVQTKFCDPEEFDYVPLKSMLQKEGIPSLLIEADKQAANYEQARTAVETFCEILS